MAPGAHYETDSVEATMAIYIPNINILGLVALAVSDGRASQTRIVFLRTKSFLLRNKKITKFI